MIDVFFDRRVGGVSSSPRGRALVLGGCLLLTIGFQPFASAQVGTAVISATSGAGEAGVTVPIAILLNATEPTAGCSYGLRVDGNAFTLDNIALGASLQVLKGGAGPDFFTIDPYASMTGFSFGAILSFSDPTDATIPAGVDHTITTFDLTVLPTAPIGTTSIELRSDLNDPGDVPVEVLATTLTSGEMDTTASFGSFQVLDGTPTATIEIVSQSAPTEAGGLATAAVSLAGSETIDGFSFAVAHDPLVLSLAAGSVTVGSDLALVRGGLGPEFISIDLYADGFTFATVVHVTAPGLGLSEDVAHEVALIEYGVLPTAPFGPTTLAFTESLGTPPVLLSVGMGLIAIEPPILVEDSLFVARPFLRGDTNQNGVVTISDVTGLLAQLFTGGVILCEDALDADGSGTLSISDATFFLEYLFNFGAPPPAPLGGCGLPPLPPTLSCDAFTCP